MDCQKVFVYRNLHKNCFSVKCVKTGLVIAHVDEIVLENVTFKVSQAGRQRVLREKRKNVHAGVQGTWVKNETAVSLKHSVTYNPYKYDSFVEKATEVPVKTAARCVIKMDGMTI